jgi:hypothetical protein
MRNSSVSTEPNYTHVAFADESNWNRGRFRSISLVTADVECARKYHQELDALRKGHNKSEFKWSRFQEREGMRLADFFFERCHTMRVDVLTWDIQDSRHRDLRGRDDRANFARMYFHLLHNVLKKRWPDETSWLICPDQQKDVNWSTLEECLDLRSWAFEDNLLARDDAEVSIREFYRIHEIRCSSSQQFLLIQLADMFAGLASFSRECFDKYLLWRRQHSDCFSLFAEPADEAPQATFSKSDTARLPVLHHVREESGRRRLQVSLLSSSGLCTKNPKGPLNFWFYTPQRQDDRAPVKLE